MEIDPKDLRIDLFYNSVGFGYSSPVVRVLHLPTGLSVESNEERSHFRNKTKALEKLKEMLQNDTKASCEWPFPTKTLSKKEKFEMWWETSAEVNKATTFKEIAEAAWMASK